MKVPGSGRRKGTPNKSTAAVKEALQLAYAAIGGDNTFAQWAMVEQTEFYKLWAKLLPQEMEATVKHQFEPLVIKKADV